MKSFDPFMYVATVLYAILSSSSLVVNATAPANGTSNMRLPLDLFLLVDASGSIANRWAPVVRFAEDLSTDLTGLAGGYYTEATDGVRLTILAFRCGGNGFRVFVPELSSDEAVISSGINTMRNYKPSMNTCPSGGLQEFADQISESYKAVGSRPSAVVILTDGKIYAGQNDKKTQQEVENTKNGINEISAAGATTFLISYGAPPSVIREWSDMLPRENMFDSTELETVSEVIAAMMLGRFQLSYLPNSMQSVQAMDFDLSDNRTLCLQPPSAGNTVDVLVQGAQAFTLVTKETLVCLFGQGGRVKPVVDSENQIVCTIPFPQDVLNPAATIDIQLGATISAGDDKTLLRRTLTLAVVPCLRVRKSAGCFPSLDNSNSNFAVQVMEGPSALVDNLECVFDSKVVPAVPLVPGGGSYPAVSCESKASSTSQALELGQNPVPFTNFVIRSANPLVTLFETHNPEVSSATACVSATGGNLPSEVCFLDSGFALPTFSGESLVALGKQFTGLEYSCRIGNLGSVPARVIDAAFTLECLPPNSILWNAFSSSSQTSLEVGIQVRSAAGSAGRGWWRLVSIQVLLPKAKSCLEMIPLANPPCLGAPFSTRFTGLGVQNLLDSGAFPCAKSQNGGCSILPQDIVNSHLVLSSQVYSNVQFGFDLPGFKLCLTTGLEPPTQCWGDSTNVVIGGASVALFKSSPPLCRMMMTGLKTTNTQAVVDKTGKLVCDLPVPHISSLPHLVNGKFQLLSKDKEVVLDQTLDFSFVSCQSVEPATVCLVKDLNLTVKGPDMKMTCQFESSRSPQLYSVDVSPAHECSLVDFWDPLSSLNLTNKFDSVTLYDSGGVTLVPSYAWTAPVVCVELVDFKTVVEFGDNITVNLEGETLSDLLDTAEFEYMCEFQVGFSSSSVVQATLKHPKGLRCILPPAFADVPAMPLKLWMRQVSSRHHRRLATSTTGATLLTTIELPPVHVTLVHTKVLVPPCYTDTVNVQIQGPLEGKLNCTLSNSERAIPNCKDQVVGVDSGNWTVTLTYQNPFTHDNLNAFAVVLPYCQPNDSVNVMMVWLPLLLIAICLVLCCVFCCLRKRNKRSFPDTADGGKGKNKDSLPDLDSGRHSMGSEDMDDHDLESGISSSSLDRRNVAASNHLGVGADSGGNQDSKHGQSATNSLGVGADSGGKWDLENGLSGSRSAGNNVGVSADSGGNKHTKNSMSAGNNLGFAVDAGGKRDLSNEMNTSNSSSVAVEYNGIQELENGMAHGSTRNSVGVAEGRQEWKDGTSGKSASNNMGVTGGSGGSQGGLTSGQNAGNNLGVVSASGGNQGDSKSCQNASNNVGVGSGSGGHEGRLTSGENAGNNLGATSALGGNHGLENHKSDSEIYNVNVEHSHLSGNKSIARVNGSEGTSSSFSQPSNTDGTLMSIVCSNSNDTRMGSDSNDGGNLMQQSFKDTVGGPLDRTKHQFQVGDVVEEFGDDEEWRMAVVEELPRDSVTDHNLNSTSLGSGAYPSSGERANSSSTIGDLPQSDGLYVLRDITSRGLSKTVKRPAERIRAVQQPSNHVVEAVFSSSQADLGVSHVPRGGRLAVGSFVACREEEGVVSPWDQGVRLGFILAAVNGRHIETREDFEREIKRARQEGPNFTITFFSPRRNG